MDDMVQDGVTDSLSLVNEPLLDTSVNEPVLDASLLNLENFEVGNDNLPWPQTFDAQAWAKQFIKYVKKDQNMATDEGTMIGWFANAIMLGYDTANQRTTFVKQ